MISFKRLFKAFIYLPAGWLLLFTLTAFEAFFQVQSDGFLQNVMPAFYFGQALYALYVPAFIAAGLTVYLVKWLLNSRLLQPLATTLTRAAAGLSSVISRVAAEKKITLPPKLQAFTTTAGRLTKTITDRLLVSARHLRNGRPLTATLFAAGLVIAYSTIVLLSRSQTSLWFYAAAFLAVLLYRLPGRFTTAGHAVMAALMLFFWFGWQARHAQPKVKTRPAKGAPNILMLVSDTTRADHMGFMGYDRQTTPNLDRLAARSAVFTSTWSPSAWTKPATAALLTSRELLFDDIHRGAASLSYDGLHMPEYFRRLGYETALFSANSNAASYFGHARGYSHRLHSLPPSHSAILRFSLIQFFTDRFQAKTGLELKNIENNLNDYADFLQLPVSDLSAYASGKKESPTKLSTEESEQMRQVVNSAIHQLTARQLRRFPKMIPAHNSPLYRPLLDHFNRMLKIFYFDLSSATGKIVDHWLQDARLVDESLAWLTKRKDAGRPFFMHVQIMGPHTPYVAQRPYFWHHFDNELFEPVEKPPTQHTPPSVPAPEMPGRQLYNMMANYDDSVRITDANLSRLIDFLKETDQFDNTIIIFTSDHGESFYEHRIYGHMNSLHRELLHVPLFFYYSKISPQRSNRPASLLDVFPTAAVLAAGKDSPRLPDSLQGRALFQYSGEQFTPAADRDFTMRFSTVVGSAWKQKKILGRPFGFHYGVMNDQWRAIIENEEPGSRLLVFDRSDLLESRDDNSPQARGLTAGQKKALTKLWTDVKDNNDEYYDNLEPF